MTENTPQAPRALIDAAVMALPWIDDAEVARRLREALRACGVSGESVKSDEGTIRVRVEAIEVEPTERK